MSGRSGVLPELVAEFRALVSESATLLCLPSFVWLSASLALFVIASSPSSYVYFVVTAVLPRELIEMELLLL